MLYFRCQQLGERGWQTSVHRPTPPPRQTGGESCYRQIESGRRYIHAETTVSSDSQLQMGLRWSDQHHLGCFRYSQSSIPGPVCFHSSETSSGNCGSSCPGHSLLITQLTSSTRVSVSIRQLTRYGSEYDLKPLKKTKGP